MLATAPAPAPAATSNSIGFVRSPASGPLLGLCFIALALSPFAVNAGLIALAALTLFGMVWLLWQLDTPPALLLICGSQWLQGSLKVFTAESSGLPLWQTSHSRSIEEAAAYTMLWSLVLAIGMRLALLGARFAHRESTIPLRAAVAVYATWSVLLSALAVALPAAAHQVLFGLGELRWAAVYVLFESVLRRRQGYSILFAVLAFEIGLGFLSYFSNFKTALLVLMLALLARTRRIEASRAVLIVLTGIGTIYLAILWSAIKGEYRTIVSEGSHDQVVRIGAVDQMATLQRLVVNVDDTAFDKATTGLIDRIAYIDYFAATIDFVPRVRPFENGRLWEEAFEHILLPRLLFPNKAPLSSDTVVAERYTGLNLSGGSLVTSISIALPAQTYVDFGAPLMLLPALFLGALYGLCFRVLLTRQTYVPYGAGMASSVGISHMLLGSSAAKTLGSLVALSAIGVAFWVLALPHILALAHRVPVANLGRDRRGSLQSGGLKRS